MTNEIIIDLLLSLKTILIYLVLILFLIDLAKADSYNKIARVLKILLFPLLIIFSIHYKKINIGLLFAALFISGVTVYLTTPFDIARIVNEAIFETATILIGILQFIVIAGVVLSWIYAFGVNFFNSLTSLIQELYENTVSIFRNVIPPEGGFDLSPLVALFVFQLAGIILDRLMGQ
jgi:YggT family protein|tara:strand:+ start:3390 stop:3920 length:531 start_codon:yes stop_codon:yes gene_type:complete